MSISSGGITKIIGTLAVSSLGTAGVTSLCRNASNQISSCSSSIRYKNNIEDFSSGSDILRRLRPVTFNWKGSGTPDLGLVAEEVAEIEPLLVTYSDNGAVEGVKYDRIGVVLINIVRKQQREIEELRGELKKSKDSRKTEYDEVDLLKKQLSALRDLVCASNPDAEACK